MYETELKELGLTDNEIKIYLILLKYGMLSPTELAKKTGLHRSYIYDATEKLLERGIINTVLINNKKSYQACDPKTLREVFELKLRQIDNILPNLSALFKSVKEETRIELHKGKRVYKTLLKDLAANIKKNDIVYLIGIDEDILINQVEPIYLKQYFTIIKEKNVKEKIIIKKHGKRLKYKNLEYKELDEKYIGNTSQIIYNNKVAIFVLGNPYYLIVIENKEVAETYKKTFNLLWNIAK